jgi:CubicO group peptidase (beta-lactamase class C family)
MAQARTFSTAPEVQAPAEKLGPADALRQTDRQNDGERNQNREPKEGEQKRGESTENGATLNLLVVSDMTRSKPALNAVEASLTAAGREEIRDGRLSREGLDKLLTRARETDSDSIVVMRDGKVLAKWFSDGEEKKLLAYSVTKSVANLAVGQLVESGKLNLDQHVSDFFAEWKNGPKQDITVRELMNHTSGLPFHAKEISLRAALDSELLAKPGSAFNYSSAAVDVLSGIVEKISGEPLDRYAAEHIFKPLGITDFNWNEDKEGHAGGGSGLWAKATDLAKIGQLMANGGSWGDRQIVSAEWIAQSTRPSQTKNSDCGLLWWLEDPHYNTDQGGNRNYVGREGFSARGARGQYVTVYPSENLVAVRQIDPARYKGENDEFSDFSQVVKELVPRGTLYVSHLH